MTKREDVIKAHVIKELDEAIIDATPWKGHEPLRYSISFRLLKEATALLKEQDNLIEEAYNKGFVDGRNNVLEAISEGM